MKITFTSFLLILLVAHSAFGQSLRGKVVAEDNGEPLLGATVYISNTTFGTITDIDGNFTISKLPKTPFTLNISYTGFQTARIEITSLEEPITVQLSSSVMQLDEVVVTPDADLWDQYGDRFLRDFIGYSKFAKACKIKNIEDLNLYYDEEKNVLSVRSAEPLIIVNNALGYEIVYWLEAYEYQFASNVSYFAGFPYFKDLTEKETKKRKINKWTKNRSESYLGSSMHFFRALYANKLKKEGFKVDLGINMKTRDYYRSDENRISYEDSDSLSQTIAQLTRKLDSENGSSIRFDKKNPLKDRVINSIKNWLKKPDNPPLNLRYIYQKDGQLITEETVLTRDPSDSNKILVEQYPVDPDIGRRSRNGKISVITQQDINLSAQLVNEGNAKKLSIGEDAFVVVTYLNEKEEEEYYTYQILSSGTKDVQESILTLPQVDYISIDQNGNFSPPNGVLFQGYWSFEKMGKMLPLNYVFEE